jgi:hypothetical protein
MKWRHVIFANKTGTAGTFRILGDDVPRNIFSCTLECGHFAQVTCMEAPSRLDCMRCGDKPVQLPLPIHLPHAREPMKQWASEALIDRNGV